MRKFILSTVASVAVAGALVVSAGVVIGCARAETLYLGQSLHPGQSRLVRPNNDRNYIGWGRMPGADQDCSGSDAIGCSRGQVGGRVSGGSTAGGWVYFGSQYTFAPGRGVIDEACNLPTSAYSNTQRDGQ
jgi:hypothetical protein